MRLIARMVLAGVLLSSATAWGQQGDRQPDIGYLYPAGGQAGTSFEVIAGGQNLRGARGEVIVTVSYTHLTLPTN